MPPSPDDLCPKPERQPPLVTRPLASPIFPATVYQCDSTQQASQLLAGETPGFVYSRDGHPNGVMLAERCAELHAADHAAITGSGMAALALAMLSQLEQGDHMIVSNQLYGRSLLLFTAEANRCGISSSPVDTCDLAQVAGALTPKTRMVIVETITNPMLHVSDIAALAKLAHDKGAVLLVDNTFASPIVCRPLQLGADLVMESVTKIMNGHSDVCLGLLAGRADVWQRVTDVQSIWGFSPGPIDCWLAARGLGTLALRVDRAVDNALAVAEMLSGRDDVQSVSYPGLAGHSDHTLAARQFGGRFGNMVTFTLPGGTAAAEQFMAAATAIPFCPSLGELCTTLSHPESTSHRGLTEQQRGELGIFGGTVRLSVGIESSQHVLEAVQQGLAGVA